PALAAGAARDLAAALARPAPAPRRLDRLPHPSRPLRLVLLRRSPARSALPPLLSAGARRAGAAAADRGAALGGGREAPCRLRPAPPRCAAAARVGSRRRGRAALHAAHDSHLRRNQALARVPRAPFARGGGPGRAHRALAFSRSARRPLARPLADRARPPLRHERL